METERLRLRPWQDSDAETLCKGNAIKTGEVVNSSHLILNYFFLV